MKKKQQLTALLIAMSLSTGGNALAQCGAPSSQFGFSGWPYHQGGGCTQSATPQPTRTPRPTAVPTAAPTPTKAPQATQKPSFPASSPSTSDDYTTGSITAQEENAFQLLNEDRIANGRAALKLDPALCTLARLKSRDMNDNHYFAHTSPTYGSAFQMLKDHGYSFTSVGENIAHHATVEKAEAAFLSSPTHRQNMMGSQWSRVGIGISTDKNGFVYVTQLFVR